MGYKGTNEIYEYVLEMTQTILLVVDVADPEDETVTCGSLYNFTMFNSLVTCHLGKMIIIPNW